MNSNRTQVLIIGEKYRREVGLFKEFGEKKGIVAHVHFLSEWHYSIKGAYFYLKYDIIISPYRLCLIHLALVRSRLKNINQWPYIILATGSNRCLDHLVKGGLCDQISSDSLISLIEEFKKIDFDNRERRFEEKIDTHEFQLAFTEFMTYIKRDAHGDLPDWKDLYEDEGYELALNYYNLKLQKAMKRENLMFVKPVFPVFDYEYDSQLLSCFMIMPFSQDLTKVYTDIIKPILVEMSIEINRADDFFTQGSIMEDVWKRISLCDFLIADLTSRNPNVYYELGIAHTQGKPVILITQNLNDVPFDIKHNRVIEYGTNYDQVEKFNFSIKESIKEVLTKLEERVPIEKNLKM